jgi:hypothetical protein
MQSDRAEDRRARLVELCSNLPEVDVRDGQHIAFTVRGRTFAYYLDDHHGDGLRALNCKVPLGLNADLVELNPARYFIPSYVGPKGWLGLRLDLDEIDWTEIEQLVTDSYRLIAPKRLVARL